MEERGEMCIWRIKARTIWNVRWIQRRVLHSLVFLLMTLYCANIKPGFSFWMYCFCMCETGLLLSLLGLLSIAVDQICQCFTETHTQTSTSAFYWDAGLLFQSHPLICPLSRRRAAVASQPCCVGQRRCKALTHINAHWEHRRVLHPIFGHSGRRDYMVITQSWWS